MAKPGVFLALLGAAILAAGAFGALHNQVSYSVGPEYFHQFKFRQFAIPPELPPRIGAAIVGWRASWWMGVVVGLPPFLLGLLLMAPARKYWSAGLRAVVAVITTTALASGIGLIFGLVTVEAQLVSKLPLPDAITDRVGFVRSGVMHDASYLGGFVGIFVAVWVIFRASRKD
ncbi:MAG: hypothetical protein ACR2O2_02180 [Ruegeria sp.]